MIEAEDGSNKQVLLVKERASSLPKIIPKPKKNICVRLLNAIFCCCKKEIDTQTRRKIDLKNPGKTEYPNVVKNQKYNVLTIIPIVLFNQFKFFSNQFFLLLCLSQFIDPLKVGFLFSYVSPLAMVLLITLVKEAIDDFFRYKRDKEANDAKYKILDKVSGKEVSLTSKEIKIGDFIVIEQNERIPADMIILKTYGDGSSSVFLRTDQLDGETDWKYRKPVAYIQDNPVLEHLADYDINMVIDPPSKLIYEFTGVMEIVHKDGSIFVTEPLTLENTMWANTVLATKKAVGCVIHTGIETRAQMNSSLPRSKVGILDLEINFLTKILFILMIGLSILIIVFKKFSGDLVSNIVNFFRFVVLLSSIIPISLKVNLDIAKVVNSWRIGRSELIPETIVRNSTLPEELGRIEYIFSDKTGTLTKNEMIFKRLSTEIDKFTPEHIDEIKMILNDECMKHNAPMMDIFRQHKKDLEAKTTKETKKIVRRDRTKVLRDAISAMALCNNVTPIHDDEGKVTYQASSPDEVALVELSVNLNMKLINRTEKEIWIQNANDYVEKYEILANFPFSSDTKRMGILLRNVDNGHIIFFLKGAESIILRFVKERYKGHISENCEELAAMGLRTLVLTQKLIDKDFYEGWAIRYKEALASLDNRSENIKNVIAELENNMEFLCISGVEDLLQDDVADTIESLKKAGIKVWMLTGDKVETATCIAISAGFIPSSLKKNSNKMFYIKDMPEKDQIEAELERLKSQNLSESILIIDGNCLEICLTDLEKLFFEVALALPAVVCCRCSPTQKANIVKTMKVYSSKRTLSIGDGGNDVAMIQEANVGVGIVGKEGKQASLAADYSITKFMHLKLLVLWFGRQSYKNTALISNFVIHRGLIISLIQFLFSIIFYCMAISIYNGNLILGYSTVYTALPVVSLLADRDTDMQNIIKFPLLYRKLQKGRELNIKEFLYWINKSLFQASIIMIGSLYFFDNVFLKIVTITFTALIFAEILNVYTTIRKFNYIIVISLLGTFLVYVLSLAFFRSILDFYYIIDLKIIGTILALTIISWLPFFIYTKVKMRCFPEDYEKLDAMVHSQI